MGSKIEMKKPGLVSGFLLLARGTSSSDWLNCCERSLAGGGKPVRRNHICLGWHCGRDVLAATLSAVKAMMSWVVMECRARCTNEMVCALAFRRFFLSS
jgi:hypothetical protein